MIGKLKPFTLLGIVGVLTLLAFAFRYDRREGAGPGGSAVVKDRFTGDVLHCYRQRAAGSNEVCMKLVAPELRPGLLYKGKANADRT
jgi:hypothetical protein